MEVGSLVSANEAWTQLNAARDRRVEGLEADLAELEQELHVVQAGNGKLAETAGAHEARITGLEGLARDLREDIKVVRDGQRTLIIVLVGFAFTVAGSAIGLAIALGGTP